MYLAQISVSLPVPHQLLMEEGYIDYQRSISTIGGGVGEFTKEFYPTVFTKLSKRIKLDLKVQYGRFRAFC